MKRMCLTGILLILFSFSLYAQVISIENSTPADFRFILMRDTAPQETSEQSIQTLHRLVENSENQYQLPSGYYANIRTFAVSYTLIGILEDYQSMGKLLLKFPFSGKQNVSIDVTEIIQLQDYILLIPSAAPTVHQKQSPQTELQYSNIPSNKQYYPSEAPRSRETPGETSSSLQNIEKQSWQGIPATFTYDRFFIPEGVYVEDLIGRRRVDISNTESWNRVAGVLPASVSFNNTASVIYMHINSQYGFNEGLSYFLYMYLDDSSTQGMYTIEIPLSNQPAGNVLLWRQSSAQPEVIGQYVIAGSALQVSIEVGRLPDDLRIHLYNDYKSRFSSSVYLNNRYEEFILNTFEWKEVLR